MLKKLKAMLIVTSLLLSLIVAGFPVSANIVLSGSGTDSNPYLISSALELNEVRNNLNASFKLTKDINMFSLPWEPVGTITAPFKGKFDGSGFLIYNLNINKPAMQYVGLFGYTDAAVIKNVTIDGASVTGKLDTGGLIGHSKKSTVENCSISNSGFIKAESNVGGLIGSKEYGVVSASNSKINVTGTINSIGGLIGDNSGIVTKSFSAGVVTGPLNVGGLIGYARGDELISQTYSAASVVGTGAGNRMGGLIGRIGSASVRVEDSFAIGTISGAGECGGLVGYSSNANIKNCYFAGSVNGSKRGGVTPSTSLIVTDSYFDSQTTGLTAPTAQARTTQQLMNVNTYVGWDFNNIWTISNSYPLLAAIDELAIVGDGTKQNPYQIKTIEHLKLMEDDCVYFKLMNNIDLNNEPWTPIHFCGVFDGNGYKISNLKIDLPNQDKVGFFKDDEPNIYNLTLENVDIRGRNYVGGFMGYETGIIENCHIIGTGQIVGEYAVGGITGYADGSRIFNSSVSVDVIGNEYVGGIIGTFGDNSLYIHNSVSNGNVTGGNNVGGIIGGGWHDGYFELINLTVNGAITGNDCVGGLIGEVTADNPYPTPMITILLKNFQMNGTYSGNSNVGEIWGYKVSYIQFVDSYN